MGLLGPTGVCVLKGGDFATSRKCRLRRWTRWLDQELWLLTLTLRRQRPGLEEGHGEISANGKENHVGLICLNFQLLYDFMNHILYHFIILTNLLL